MTVFLVCSPGGHLEELVVLARRQGVPEDEVHWVTTKTPQTMSVLAGQRVHWVPRVASGDYAGAAKMLPQAWRLHRRHRPRQVISTGAALAVPHLLVASMSGCPVRFIESATRLTGPSRTGRLVQRLPRSELLAQGSGWGDPRWATIPDVFSTYTVTARPESGSIGLAVVSLGTERFPFTRALRSSAQVLAECSAEVQWQIGNTPALDADQPLTQWLRADLLRESCARADVVVTHGGVGSVLMALESGKVPVIMPRSRTWGEHIDDHQIEFAASLQERGLAVVAEPDGLTRAHLEKAASLQAHPSSSVPAPLC